jgi:hypothetical protein
MSVYRVANTSSGWATLTSSGEVVAISMTRAAAVLEARDRISPQHDQLLVQLESGAFAAESDYLEELWRSRACPSCEQAIADQGGIGGGRIKQGVFCSLTCFHRYYRRELQNRAGLTFPN